MKTPDQVIEAITKRLTAGWHLDITGTATNWPHNVPLGTDRGPALEAGFATVQQQSLKWRDWAAEHHLTLISGNRRVHGTSQPIPTHLRVPDLDTAAALSGHAWRHRLARGRTRLAALRTRFPDTTDLPRLIRAVDAYSDTDFDLLCTAATWFQHNSASGLTPRQVPIEGLHAKWLNHHHRFIRALAGIDTLGLLPDHPPRIHFTYLDPRHLDTGHRRHDSATVGDTMTPAYRPETVIISENKDTALHFPRLPRAISVEGAGFGAAAFASFPWIITAPHLIYWGDIDAAGLEIVDNFRREGLPVRTVLMDLATYETYERYGATTDAKGRPLGVPDRKNTPHLAPPEQMLYHHLTDPAWTRPRRVEQERIPLPTALAAVTSLTTQQRQHPTSP